MKGKAAPGYAVAKTIIKFINNISHVLCSDPDVSPYLKVVFLPNYNVTNAQTIIPASDALVFEDTKIVKTAGNMKVSGRSILTIKLQCFDLSFKALVHQSHHHPIIPTSLVPALL